MAQPQHNPTATRGGGGRHRVGEWLVRGMAVGLAVVMLFVPGYILWLTWTGAPRSAAEGLLTLNTKDSTRVAEDSPSALSLRLSRTVFPEGINAVPDAVVVAPADGWQMGAAAAVLQRGVSGPLLLDDGSGAVAAEIARLRPQGAATLGGATMVRVGAAAGAGPVVSGSSPAEVAAGVDEMRTRVGGGMSGAVVLVPEDPRYALPAAYWAAQSGQPLLFGGDLLPEPTRQALQRRQGAARIYVVGPVTRENLDRYGTVRRIGSADEAATAVGVAKFFDEATGVGWGRDVSRYDADHRFVLAARDQPTLAAGGLALGVFGGASALLWVERDRVPPATAQYLWTMKPEFFVTPAEGPFNHLWVLGGPHRVGTWVQGQADLSQEIGAYRFEEAGLSSLETVFVVLVVTGIACGLWLLLHSWLVLPQISGFMRASWVLLGLALGPAALWLYRYCYHGVAWMRHSHADSAASMSGGGMVMWQRSGLRAVLAAAAMNRGFDGPLMLVISWLVTAAGLPLLVFGTRGVFWLGNPMMFAIFIAYFGALALHWLGMHAVMFMRHERLSYPAAVRRAFLPAAATMTAMAVGMMGFMWWVQMVELMMEGMPEDDEIMWWGTTLVAVAAGLLVALPVDNWLVRRGRQPGTM